MSHLLGSLITPASRLAQPNWEGLSDMHRSDCSIELGNKLQGGFYYLEAVTSFDCHTDRCDNYLVSSDIKSPRLFNCPHKDKLSQ